MDSVRSTEGVQLGRMKFYSIITLLAVAWRSRVATEIPAFPLLQRLVLLLVVSSSSKAAASNAD